MTDMQLNKLLKMVRLVVNGCDTVEEVKRTLDDLIDNAGMSKSIQKSEQDVEEA